MLALRAGTDACLLCCGCGAERLDRRLDAHVRTPSRIHARGAYASCAAHPEPAHRRRLLVARAPRLLPLLFLLLAAIVLLAVVLRRAVAVITRREEHEGQRHAPRRPRLRVAPLRRRLLQQSLRRLRR